MFEWVGEWIGEAIASAGGCVGEAAAASAYVAGVGALAAVTASDELEESEQTEPSFIQLFTLVMASVCVIGSVIQLVGTPLKLTIFFSTTFRIFSYRK